VSGRQRGLLLTTGGVVLVSCDALLIRLQSTGVWTIIFWRGILTAIALSIAAAAIHRGDLGGVVRSVTKPSITLSLLSMLTTVLFVLSISQTSVAHALVILAATPVITAALARVFVSEVVPARTWVVGVVVLGLMAAIFRSSLTTDQSLGDLCAIGASITVAGTLVVLRRFPDVDRASAMAFGALLTAAVAVPFATSLALTGREAAIAALAGLLILPISRLLIAYGPRYLAASEIGLILMLEAVIGPGLVWWLLGEAPAAPTALTSVLVLVALAAHSILEYGASRKQRTGASCTPGED
jgi:drug/metabolite transporter (DMT)-like permease